MYFSGKTMHIASKDQSDSVVCEPLVASVGTVKFSQRALIYGAQFTHLGKFPKMRIKKTLHYTIRHIYICIILIYVFDLIGVYINKFRDKYEYHII